MKCWDTKKLTDIIYKNSLNRTDILEKEDPANKFIIEHEEKCSYAGLLQLAEKIKDGNDTTALKAATEMINLDINIREQAIKLLALNLAKELFYFGQPMFKALSYFNLGIQEKGNTLEVVL